MVLICLFVILVVVGESVEYGHDGCCVRYGWFSAETVDELQCPVDEHHYDLPHNAEQGQWCMTLDDMLKLTNHPDAQSFYNSTDASQQTYTLLTKHNFASCTQNPSQCGLVFMSCVMKKCLPTPHAVPSAAPTPDQNDIETFEPSASPIDCDNSFRIQDTYVQYTPLSQPISTTSTADESILDNRQPTLRLRFLFAENGANPWETNISNGEAPKSPFMGQVVITLTDETQEFPGWVECDGREYNVMMYPQLFDTLGYVYGANWNRDTFMIPDCTNKVLIHHSQEFVFGVTAGNDDIELTQNGILLPPHRTHFETGYVDLTDSEFEHLSFTQNSGLTGEIYKYYDYFQESELLETDIKVSISENIVNYENTVTQFNNMQKYLALNFLIVSHGKLPWEESETIDDTSQTSSASDGNEAAAGQNEEHSGADRRLYVGEIVISANHLVPPGFLACDGSYLHVHEYAKLFQVLGFKYGGNAAIQQFKLPDCRGRAAMHKMDSERKTSLVGETGDDIISELSANATLPHTHGEFHFISQSNVLAHIETFEDEDQKECEPVSNFMPYIVMNFAYYIGANEDACKKSHFLGAVGIFAFEVLPSDFSNQGLSHDLKNHENNKLKDTDLMSYVSNDFVWSTDCIILPNFDGKLLAHSIHDHEFATVIGTSHVGCDVLIPHQHVTFITTVDTYCGQNDHNVTSYSDPIDTNDESCQMGQWTEYSSCIFDETSGESDASSQGFQFRTRKLYVNTEKSESDSEESGHLGGCQSKRNCEKTFHRDNSHDCECDDPSRLVRECSIDNCLQIKVNGDRKSYFDTKWKLFNQDGSILATGRDDGYGSEEGCIIVEKGTCYKLHLYDRSGDGLCCDYGSGNVRWYFENQLLGFYYNNDNWYEQVIDVCVPDYGSEDDDLELQSGEEECISINITGDGDIEYENFWNIYDAYGNTVMTSSKPHVVPARDCDCRRLQAGCYDLVVFDESGDGICCKGGKGILTVSQGESLLVSYRPNQNDYFTFKKFHFCV